MYDKAIFENVPFKLLMSKLPFSASQIKNEIIILRTKIISKAISAGLVNERVDSSP